MNVMQRLSAGLRKKKTTPARMTATHRLITRDSCVFLLSNFEFIKSRPLCTYMTEETKHHSSSCTNRKSAPVSSLCLHGYSLVHYWEWTNRCDEHLQWLMMMDKDVHYRQGWPHALTDIQSVPLPSMPPHTFFPLPPVCQSSMIIILPSLSLPVLYTHGAFTVNSMLC